MKNTGKNRSSCSVSEAATQLGVSIPTVRRMQADRRLEGFRTPGGHLRITAESIDAVREHQQARPRPLRDASTVLQNRRERLEELTLEAQEHRARRELEKLRTEEQEEVDRREAEAQAREEEAAQRRAELQVQRERLEHDKAQERVRQQRERALEEQRRQVERDLAAFRSRWKEKASEYLSAWKYGWLSAIQRKEILEGVEAEVDRRQTTDEPRMPAILARSLEALVEPLESERNAQRKRQQITEWELFRLACAGKTPTEIDKMKATTAIRDALQQFDSSADESEMRVAAREALHPVCLEIDQRQAKNQRKAARASAVQIGLNEMSDYLSELENDGQIEWDMDFRQELKALVERRLENELPSDATPREIKNFVREIIDGELE